MGVLEAALIEVLRPVLVELQEIKARLTSLAEVVAEKVPDPDRLWRYSEVALKCRVKPSTVRTWVSRGRLTAVQKDGRTLIPDAELRRLLKNGGLPLGEIDAAFSRPELRLIRNSSQEGIVPTLK